MHRLVFFDDRSVAAADGWRLRAGEVLDFEHSAQILARCRQRETEMEALCRDRLEEAWAAGFAQGLAEGRAAARQAAAGELQHFLAELAQERARRRRTVGRLALEALRHVLGEIGADRAVELFVARRLDDLKDEEPLELRVAVGRGATIARRFQDRGIGLRVVEDATLAADECAFELRQGRAHAGLGLQVEALEAMIGQVEERLDEGGGA